MALSVFDLGRIQIIHKQTRNVSRTAAICKVSRGTVYRAIENHFTVRRRNVRTSKKVLQRRRELLKIVSLVSRVEHRVWPTFSSASQIRDALFQRTGEFVSKRTVQRELKTLGCTPYVRPKYATRTRKDLRAKKEFAKKHRNTSWKRIVFSDESWISCVERTGRIQYAKRRCDVLGLERKARWNVPSIMIWGAIGHNFKSELIVFPSKVNKDGMLQQFRLDAESYVRRCLSSVVAQLVAGNRLLQQDGARSHAAKSTVSYLRRKGVQMLEPWPPYSPELNAIERIWKELNERVGRRCPMTQEALIRVAKEEWEKLPGKVIDAHCKHFAAQVKAL